MHALQAFLKSFWRVLPEQIKRLAIFVVIIPFLFLGVRFILVPHDFGDYGHYRAGALHEVSALPISYAGQESCAKCHAAVFQARQTGAHDTIACESCHGPAIDHAESPNVGVIREPKERKDCLLCHDYLASRATGFPEIVGAAHYPAVACVKCHPAHAPELSIAPQCESCHAEIARTKALSAHKAVACADCHQAPKEHKLHPRAAPPEKPLSKELCAACHVTVTPETKNIPKIELATHAPRYACWQCHNLHSPEAP